MNRMSVALFSSRAKAAPINERLRQAGFDAELHDELRLRKLWFLPSHSAGVRIAVPADQFEGAEQKLLDWDAAEGALREAIRCPECRSLRVQFPQFTPRTLLTNFFLGMAAELGLVEKDYYCEDCHFTWPKEGYRARRNRSHMAPYYFIAGVEQKPPEARA